MYVYTYNSHASVLSSHPISGKQGFLHKGKVGKITDYFFFERFPLFVRIMKFEHLSGGNSDYCLSFLVVQVIFICVYITNYLHLFTKFLSF